MVSVVVRDSRGLTMIARAQSDERFDYQAPAELFSSKSIRVKSRVFKYMRFEHAADAVRLAIEKLPSDFSWESIWKLMKSDTTAVEFVGCMNTLNIHSRVSPKTLRLPDFCRGRRPALL